MSDTVIIIMGPTAVGKTEIAIEVAKKINGEIISADSRQIYKGLIIGTSAPVNPEVPYHLVNFLDPKEQFNAMEFSRLANELIKDIHKRKKRAIVVGGTGLYIRALLGNFFLGNTRNENIRSELRKRHQKGENLWNELNLIDPELAAKIHPNDFVRIERALEVYYTTGKTMTYLRKFGNHQKPDFISKKFLLTMNKDDLYKKINKRVDEMINSGFLNEVQNLLNSGIPANSPGLQSLGYQEIVNYLNGNISLPQTIEKIKQRTRQYARRQLIWFKSEKDTITINLSNTTKEEAIKIITELSK